MSDWQDNILREPISRNTGAVLSLPVNGTHQHFKTRFLAEDVDGLWIESPPSRDPALITELIASAAMVAVAFKRTSTKFTFDSCIRKEKNNLRIADGSRVAALLLSNPAEIRSVQLRAHLRVQLPEDHEMAFRFWKMPAQELLKDAPHSVNELKVEIQDISLGGLSIRCRPVEREVIELHDRDRLRILLAHRDCSIMLEGIVLYPNRAIDGTVLTGVQFEKNENGVGSDSKLTKLKAIVAALHRPDAAAASPDGKAAH